MSRHDSVHPKPNIVPDLPANFVVKVTKVERRLGKRHSIAEDPDAPLDSPLSAAISSDEEENTITQTLKKKRDQFLERRMSTARVPRSGPLSPIAKAMGYDGNLSNEDVEDEIDFQAVTASQRIIREYDTDYTNHSSSDEEFSVDSKDFTIKSTLNLVRQ